MGAIMALANWFNYRRDTAHKGIVAARLWAEIIQAIEFTNCTPDTLLGGSDCGGDCMGCCIRVNEGHIQTLNCGVWEDIPGGDLNDLLPGGVTQAPPGGTLEPGQSVDYCPALAGSNSYLLPVSVNEGDTITISAASGGWSDGDIIGPFGAAWSCPNGSVYALGGCGAANGTVGTDPLPTVDHMRLIVKIGADYYDAYNTTITVPAGVSGAPVVFQANDDALSNNLGSISFCANVTAGAALPANATYGAGTGPTQIVNGGTYVFNSDASGNPALGVTFDRPVKITVITSTLDHPICATTCGYYVYFSPPGTVMVLYSYPPTRPIDVPPTPGVEQWSINSGGGGPTYTITAKIEY